MRFIYLTDHTQSNGFDILPHLPQGSLAILRDYTHPIRAPHLQALARTARRHRIPFLIAASPGIALRTHATGLHAPEHLIPHIPGWRRQNRRWRITCAAHSPKAVIRARRAGADAALCSPLYSTTSHPNAPTLGLFQLRRLSHLSPFPLVPLGGIRVSALKKLSFSGFFAFAGIGVSKELVKKPPLLLHCGNIKGQKSPFIGQ